MTKLGDYQIDTYNRNDGKGVEFYAYVDTEVVLANCFERITNLEELAESKDVDMWCEDSVAEFLAEHTGYEKICSDNSYNWSSSFTAEVNFTVMSHDSDWVNSDGGYVILRVHQGGDVRGNYSQCRIYKFDSEGAYAFLDSSDVGVVLMAKDEECEGIYTSGYQSEPLYAFNQDFKIYGINNDGEILCKRLEDGKRMKAYLDCRGLY